MGQKQEPKKEKREKPAEEKINRNVGENPSKLIAELAPGKKGGDFELPFGGKIRIESGLLSKKDVITCCMIAPSDRYKYLPPLRYDEHLLSEIYLLATNIKNLKRNLQIKLPYYPENFNLFDLQLLWKPPDGEEWMNKEFTKSQNGNFVEFETFQPGIYVVTSNPRRERFVIPVQGCLFNSKLSHQISVRFPKKATDVDLQCDIQISPLNRENVEYLRKDHPHDMIDLICASDFVEVRPQVHRDFRRNATIKLPLPQMESDDFPHEDLAIMHITQTGWELLEVPLKITKSAVSFETRILTKYCVALARPQRTKRLREAFKHLTNDLSITRGDLIPFIHIQDKLWTLWFECIPNERIEAVVAKRQSQGFVRCSKRDKIEEEENEKPAFRKNWKVRLKAEEKKVERTDIDLINGKSFDLVVGGDVTISEEDPGKKNTNLYFLDRLTENYRKFLIEPLPTEDGKSVTGSLKAIMADSDDSKTRKTVACYDFEVNADAVKAFFYVEPEPEPEVAPTPSPIQEVEMKAPTPTPTPILKKEERPFTASFMRLCKPTKPPRLLIKESKVLTGRSLMNLAREVDQGLTLAIHLDISDSTITGMGFDALASGLNLVDITYRILMLWKRRTSKLKARQPDLLADALQEMGRNDLADVVMQCHRENREIFPDCFESIPDKVASFNHSMTM